MCVPVLGYKGLYGDMDQDPLCHVADSDCLSLGDSSLLTPIDRLYSMQDSYFTSWKCKMKEAVHLPPSASLSGLIIYLSGPCTR